MKIFNLELTSDPDDNSQYFYTFMGKINLKATLDDYDNIQNDNLFLQKIGKEFMDALKDARNIDA